VPYVRGPSRVTKRDTPIGMFLFGVSYAVASLSCTLSIFLSLVSGASASGSPLQAIGSSVAYGVGMALVVAGSRSRWQGEGARSSGRSVPSLLGSTASPAGS
jgi:cytochrome c biogenesis protein CcdA